MASCSNSPLHSFLHFSLPIAFPYTVIPVKRFFSVVGIVLLIAVGVGGGYFLGQQMQTGDAVAATTPSLQTGAASETNSAAPAEASKAETAGPGLSKIDARVVPSQESDLSLNTNGIVAEVLVSEGEKVEAGQVLVRVDTSLARVSVAQAEANLARAQATLNKIKSGARQQEIDQAQAAVDAALARYNKLANATLPGEVAAAQASIASAQASYAKTAEGASDQELIASRNDLANAEAKLRSATSNYNEVKWRSDIGMLPESLELEQATNAYNAAKARLADLEGGAS